MPGTTNWASSRCDRPVPGTATARSSVWHLGVSDCSLLGLDADLHEMEIAIRGVHKRPFEVAFLTCLLTSTQTPRSLQGCNETPLQRRHLLQRRHTSNDTYLSNTATKGL